MTTPKQQCAAPYLFTSESRCCICRGKIETNCECSPQAVVNHFVQCHIPAGCEDGGHPDVAQMVMFGFPQPTEPCRHCGEIIKMGLFPPC